MTGLFGWFGQDPAIGREAALRRMLQADRQPPADTPAASLAHPARMAATGVRSRQIEVDGVHLAIVGHPHWVDGPTRSPDLHALALALRAGADAASRLVGDFAVAMWDERSQRGLLAVDRIGVHPLFYGHAPGALVFASNLDLLRGHPDIRSELSKQGLYDFLYFHVCAGPHTIFTGLERLAAGHCVEFDGTAAAAPRPYWTMRFAPDATRPLRTLEDEFVGLLQDAVRELSADASSVGAFLSGGTDSSTVSGMLGRATGAPAHTFSIGFDVQGYDEMEYARVAAQIGRAHV